MTDITPTHPAAAAPDMVAQLIRRCLAGDQRAYAALYEQYAAAVYRLCYSLLLQKQDAEDVAQDTFVYAFKNLARFDAAKSAFKTWLFTIAVSRCRNMYRRKHRWFTLDWQQLLHLAAPHSETPEAVLAQQHASAAIHTALGELSPRLREALVLRYGHGLTYREIAGIMDCPPKTAESRVRLAQEHLRTRLQAVGHGLLEELLQVQG
ncbi:MAG: sigma-70 family RNA polymerase sigma factor [Anaerolineae bacterium]|jgi:RNA polymerase sigma-70 factor (ECF subfamily)|nr:sigma-70 family RNA polymerase sigma factor [Anaerolineae bacterium]